MSISGVSFSDGLIQAASQMQSGEVQTQIAVAIMKQIQDQQQIQAAGLIQMITQSASLTGTGQIIDVSA